MLPTSRTDIARSAAVLTVRAEYEQSKNALKRAVEINPSDANALAAWGSAQSFDGEINGAIELLEFGLKLDPMLEPTYIFDLEVAYYLARRHEDVLRVAELGLARYPDFPVFNTPAAAAAAQLGAKGSGCRATPKPCDEGCLHSTWT